jgi:hypothetical protein
MVIANSGNHFNEAGLFGLKIKNQTSLRPCSSVVQMPG